MTKEQYLKQRAHLLAEGKTAVNAGSMEEFKAKKAEIEKLDMDFEAAATARANLAALEGSAVVADIPTLGLADVNIPAAEVFDGAGALPDAVDPYGSTEYRAAFMNHVLKGEAIPGKFVAANETTKTTDVGAVIPTHVVEKIIEKMEATGMIWSRVTKTNLKGGVEYPTSSVKPEAEWVAEGEGSKRQKKPVGKIVFSYHKMRCAVSMTLEVSVMSLPVFETTLINNVVEAMIKLAEQSIVSGDGTGKMKGIITETPNAGQEIAAKGTIKDLEEAEANLPIEYEAGAVWCMTKKTFMHYATIKDANGQPVGRTNYGGVTNRPERILLGRSVVLCNYLTGYDKAEKDTVFGFLFDFSDYAVNTNYEMRVKKYEDNETDDEVTKAIQIMDGKVIDKGSLVTLKKA